MNSRVLLGAASCLTLASCAIKQPPVGEEIMPESARGQIRGHWAGPHRGGNVVPNWVLTFHDPELTALVADAVERNPDLKAAAARVEASRAAVRIAASSLYPRIAMKGLASVRDRNLVVTSVAGSIHRTWGTREPKTLGAPGSTPARMNRHSDGYTGSLPVPHGRLTFGAGFAPKKLLLRLKAWHWRPTMNLPGNRSPLPWRARTSRPSRLRNRKPTRRKLSISTRSIRSSRMCANNTGSRALLIWRRSSHAPLSQRMHSTPHSRYELRRSARSKSSPAVIPPENLMCDVPFPTNREAFPQVSRRNFLSAGPTLSRVSAASPPLFTA